MAKGFSTATQLLAANQVERDLGKSPRHGAGSIRGDQRLEAQGPTATLARLVWGGDDPRNRVVLELLPLVKGVAARMRSRLPAHMEMDDLVAAGVLGLLDAVRKFDPRKRVKIQSYARHRIRGAILDNLRSLDYASRNLRETAKRVEKVHQALESKLERPASDPEMARALGLTLPEWYRILHQLRALGMHWLRPKEERSPLAAEVMVADDRDDPWSSCYRQEQRELLRRALASLPERQRLIVSLYYNHCLTMKQIGHRLGIDESRVSQIHSQALRRLRARVKIFLSRPQPRPLLAYAQRIPAAA